MPVIRNGRQVQRLYQPPLPWGGDPGLVGTAPARAPRATIRPSTTKRGRNTADSRQRPGHAAPPRRAVPYGDWRLDERTRRAGRQGVAAARAALAGTTRPAARQQADAA